MKMIRLAELLAYKYKVAAKPEEIEGDVRRSITQLWEIANKRFNILRSCAESGVAGANTPDEKLAEAGYNFTKSLLNTIDVLKVNQATVDLKTLRAKFREMKALIDSQMKADDRGKQDFPSVSMLVYFLVPAAKKHDERQKGGQYAKARTGLINLYGIISDGLFNLNKLKMMESGKSEEAIEDAENEYRTYDRPRLKPRRAPLSEYDITPFIRQYGLEFGIQSNDDWRIAFENDPSFKEQIHTVINALKRGHSPRDEASVKMQLAQIFKEHAERMATNAPLFEAPEEQAQQQLNQLPPEEEWSKQMHERKKQKQEGVDEGEE